MICGLLNGMWSVYDTELLYDIWVVVWYVTCCLVRELLYGMWAVV